MKLKKWLQSLTYSDTDRKSPTNIILSSPRMRRLKETKTEVKVDVEKNSTLFLMKTINSIFILF